MTGQSEAAQLAEVVGGFLMGDGAHYDILQSLVRRLVNAQQLKRSVDREELTAEIVAALYRNLKAGQFHGNSLKALEVYIYSMVKNRVATHLRTVHRLQYWEEVPARYGVPEGSYDSGVTKRDLSEKILALLPEQCRELLELKFRHFWSDQQLADRYGKSKNAMSTAISRCVKKAQELEIVKDAL